MAVWFDEERGRWSARASGRHPITKKPSNLVRVGMKTKTEAERMERKLIAQLQAKFLESAHPLFPTVVEEDLEQMAKEGMSGVDYQSNKKFCLGKHASPIWKFKRIDQITTLEIKNVVSEADCSETYKKDILKYIRQVFNFALEAGYINRNPCPKMKFKINQKMFDVLNEKELKKFLREAKKRKHPWYPVWLVAVHSGMRASELYSLEMTSIDLHTNMIKVQKSFSRKTGIKHSTKAMYDRIFEMYPPLRKMVEKLMKERAGEQFLLPRLKDWDSGCQAAVLREFLNEIGVTSVRFHDLRASWATLLLSKGVPPAQVMKMGGWKDWKTFQRYIRKAGIDIRGATKVLSCLDDED